VGDDRVLVDMQRELKLLRLPLGRHHEDAGDAIPRLTSDTADREPPAVAEIFGDLLETRAWWIIALVRGGVAVVAPRAGAVRDRPADRARAPIFGSRIRRRAAAARSRSAR